MANSLKEIVSFIVTDYSIYRERLHTNFRKIHYHSEGYGNLTGAPFFEIYCPVRLRSVAADVFGSLFRVARVSLAYIGGQVAIAA